MRLNDELNEGLFLTEEETKTLTMYLAYGVGLGVLVGMFVGNIELFFALGGVVAIVISLIKTFINRLRKVKRVRI